MSVRLFISIVSHGHADLLARSLPYFIGVENVHVCVVDNVGEAILQSFCLTHAIDYIAHPDIVLGFGSNNNLAFRHFESNYDFASGDYFICCNPDVLIVPEMLCNLAASLEAFSPDLAGINLFVDEQYQSYDNSIRRFPKISDYLNRIFYRSTSTALDKASVEIPTESDWAAGSFLVFSARLFRSLNGFDERFFMYFEDVDICLRAWRHEGVRLLYFPSVQAVHFAAFRNRKLFSKHFYWYFCSLFRYFLRFYFMNAFLRSEGNKNR
ncbi:glycosyltransferase family protein [Metapseudomonas otitidis]|uniref:glycosyltransferase family 2 protein n=1 Tax=Metapseudomonas otitidis TaxID=319939 RepID=UPI0013F60339|nr:glycosyltransferase family 2 protein [Pseudomonas otitidis]